MIILLFFTIFPDIDESSSKIAKKSRPFSYITTFLGHRNIFHTVYFPAAISLVLLMFNLKLLSLASLLGYLLHLFLDMFTKKGINLFYPLSKKKITGFIKVGSLIENLLFATLLLLIIYKLLQ